MTILFKHILAHYFLSSLFDNVYESYKMLLKCFMICCFSWHKKALYPRQQTIWFIRSWNSFFKDENFYNETNYWTGLYMSNWPNKCACFGCILFYSQTYICQFENIHFKNYHVSWFSIIWVLLRSKYVNTNMYNKINIFQNTYIKPKKT